MTFRCRACMVVFKDDSMRTDGLIFLNVLTYLCKDCKRTGNKKPSKSYCAFCDEKHDSLNKFRIDGKSILLCDRCHAEEKQ